MKNETYFLGVETSCDETSVAVVSGYGDILSNVIASQIDIHARYGGVVPEIASRNHVGAIVPCFNEALKIAGIKSGDITAVCATTEPGLPGAVMVGRVFGASLANALNVPFKQINHIAGHIASVFLSNKNLVPPCLAVVVSGGHTSIYEVDGKFNASLLAATQDDACGEAFDKVAKVLGLEYPGGPKVSKIAEEYEGELMRFTQTNFLKTEISFSGLKTAVLNYVNTKKQKGEEIDLPFICSSFEAEAIEQLITKIGQYIRKTGIKTVCLCGGVSANWRLCAAAEKVCKAFGARLYLPAAELTGDNGAMIAGAGLLGITLLT
ncbi:MAG: tRNA (adenosine(37)-N6)-threonylcarbamoyltransferase complex transferase subunit TsaD [Christensenellaceae bacterium]|jgi:N6-L-threonylcarbamoyladenine synthase|nr:tRNA (adenosine(37)-N6)-threonylcarbamoyltransferase complex transferase subunit TsaD [Christensenellaceae bacterium]